MNDAEIRIPDGALAERDGGGVQFSLIAPRNGENNTSLECDPRSLQCSNSSRAFELEQ